MSVSELTKRSSLHCNGFARIFTSKLFPVFSQSSDSVPIYSQHLLEIPLSLLHLLQPWQRWCWISRWRGGKGSFPRTLVCAHGKPICLHLREEESRPGHFSCLESLQLNCVFRLYTQSNDYSWDSNRQTLPQAKHHKLSLLFTSLTIHTSLTFITRLVLSLDKFYHYKTFITFITR